MSLNSKSKLKPVAIKLCRELRKNSTHTEKIFWEAVRNRKFMGKKFNRQFPLFYDMGGKESFYIADFYCHELKLIIEIDGGYHEKQKEYDKPRTEDINDLGLTVIRFTNSEISTDLHKCLSIIKMQYN